MEPLTAVTIALINLAATAVVKRLISGEDPSADEWAGVATAVVGALLSPASQRNEGINAIHDDLRMMPIREYDKHMLTGRRFLQGLPTQRLSEDDRRHLIWDAHGEFIRASSIAAQQRDLLRQVEAEVCVAGSWLWVPSLPQVKSTLRQTCNALTQSILKGEGAAAVRAYRQVLPLCQKYGEVAADEALPLDPSAASTIPAALVIETERWKWTRCLGIDMRIGDVTYDYSGWHRANRAVAVSMEVTNVGMRPISVALWRSEPRSSAVLAPSSSWWDDAIESVRQWWSGPVPPTPIEPAVSHDQYVAGGETWAGELRSPLPWSAVGGVNQLAVIVRRMASVRLPSTQFRPNLAMLAKSPGIAFLVLPPDRTAAVDQVAALLQRKTGITSRSKSSMPDVS
ncbi:hypothetical protein [Nocardia sp. NPDC050710]|uniref:hypothetical protein n=1 Tax=Nocardia sp. NPDC050710 TaxID=3157220 RepID=UPI0033ECFBDD